MVDQESRSYRPRRAFIEPEPEPTPPPAPAPAPAPASTGRPVVPDFDDEDAPKPLYRDEYLPKTLYRDEPAANGSTAVRPPTPVNGSAASPGPAAPAGAPRPDADDVGSEDTAIRSFTFAPRTRRTGDDTSTTLLARSGSTARGRTAPAGPDEIDDYDEDDEDARPINERARWALAVGVIAAVVVLGLAIGYAVLGLGNTPTTTAPDPSVPAGSIGPDPTTSATEAPPTNGALLTNEMMLTAAQAKPLDDERSWKETLTQRGASDNAPVPACFGAEPEPGQPVSQQKILRVLSSTGKGGPSALHDATAYATPEEAAQAFATASRTLGTCPATSSWIASGRIVKGVGDQAVGAVIAVVDGKTTVNHSVVVNRTGRVLNVLDVGRTGDAAAPAAVAGALGEVVKVQCGPAGGKCDARPQVQDGPPPLGGDSPGWLAQGDLPPVAGAVAPWNAAPVELPKEDFVGSSCENVDWTTVAAEDRSERVYLHPDSGNAYFGVNQIVLRLKDAKAATALVEKIKDDIADCKKRRLTATVSDAKEIRGVGAQGTDVAGYTFVVEQKGTQGTDKFRVGIVHAGAKVAYTFANPKGDVDFSDGQWNVISARAGERTTQVN